MLVVGGSHVVSLVDTKYLYVIVPVTTELVPRN